MTLDVENCNSITLLGLYRTGTQGSAFDDDSENHTFSENYTFGEHELGHGSGLGREGGWT